MKLKFSAKSSQPVNALYKFVISERRFVERRERPSPKYRWSNDRSLA